MQNNGNQVNVNGMIKMAHVGHIVVNVNMVQGMVIVVEKVKIVMLVIKDIGRNDQYIMKIRLVRKELTT